MMRDANLYEIYSIENIKKWNEGKGRTEIERKKN